MAGRITGDRLRQHLIEILTTSGARFFLGGAALAATRATRTTATTGTTATTRTTDTRTAARNTTTWTGES